jgi:drug/metabolite transporter (DMT)-like permease
LPFVIIGLLLLAWLRGGFFESMTINGDGDWQSITWQNWACFVYVALFSQLIGFFFWYGGMAVGGVARVSQVQLIQLFSTLSFAALINQEIVSQGTWLVGLLVVMIIFINKKAAIKTG